MSEPKVEHHMSLPLPHFKAVCHLPCREDFQILISTRKTSTEKLCTLLRFEFFLSFPGL